MITLVKSQSNSKSLLAVVTQFKISLYIVLAMPKSRGNGSAGKRSTRQRTVVSSAGVGTRRSSRRAPATDQRSDALRPADRPPPSSSVADVIRAAHGGCGKPCKAGDEGTVGDPVPTTSCSVPTDPVPVATDTVNDPVPATTAGVVVDLLPYLSLPSVSQPSTSTQ